MNINDPISAIMTTNVTIVGPTQKLIDVKHIFEKKRPVTLYFSYLFR